MLLLQQKALEAAMNDINSSFGKGSVTRLGSLGGALVYVLFSPLQLLNSHCYGSILYLTTFFFLPFNPMRKQIFCACSKQSMLKLEEAISTHLPCNRLNWVIFSLK